jgi:hypothetical protein
MSFSEDPTQGREHGAAAGDDPTGAGGAEVSIDPTQANEARGPAFEDPTQGVEGGEAAFEDPTQGGSRPGEDPTAPAT